MVQHLPVAQSVVISMRSFANALVGGLGEGGIGGS